MDYARLLKFIHVTIPWSSSLTVLLVVVGLIWSLWLSPTDYQQGEMVRIMYIHVPAAWMSLLIYTVIATSSIINLTWKCHTAAIIAKASSPIGAAFTFICLVTGALWGKPMWGTYWVWDARLTSVLILLFLYIGHISLMNAFDDCRKGEKASAILALVGFINIPIIKFSVDLWNTLHQQASITQIDSSAIAVEMLTPLFVMTFAFNIYYITLLLVRVQSEIFAVQVRILLNSRVFTGK